MNFPVIPLPAPTALLTVLCGFVLKVTLTYDACRLTARVLTSPALRFLVWISFLLSCTVYWLLSIARLFVVHDSGTAAPLTARSSIHTVLLSPQTYHLLGPALVSAVGLYATALLAMLLLGAWKRLQLARALRFRLEPAPAMRQSFENLAKAMRASSCKLWLLPGLTSPAERGWARPVVYLPADYAVKPTTIEEALLHELSHGVDGTRCGMRWRDSAAGLFSFIPVCTRLSLRSAWSVSWHVT